MADILTKEQRHRCMSRVRSKNTKPEILLRKALWRLGFRYIVNDHRLPGSPDIVLPKYRTVVFVHGCFWHGHIGCKKYTIPDTNPVFWSTKIVRNQARDQDVWRQLEAKGWNVIVIWECELSKNRILDTTNRIASQVKENGLIYLHRLHERSNRRKSLKEENKERQAKEAAALKEINAICGNV